MKKKNISEVELEQVTMAGVDATSIQWIFGPEDEVPTFSMRRFVMKPGGRIPLHGHPWEHEIYFVKGTAEVFTDELETKVGPGDALFVPPDEPHGYRNSGDEDLEFICIVPKGAR